MHAIRSTAPPERQGHWRPAVAVAAATLALSLPLAGWLPASAAPAVVFDYTITGGLVTPQDPDGLCVNPLAGCAMEITGTAAGSLSGDLSLSSEWDFWAVMQLTQVSDTQWTNGSHGASGLFTFMRKRPSGDEASADLLGQYVVLLDITTFTATIDYEVTSYTGLLAGYTGSGRSIVNITPGAAGGTFDEQGRFEFGQAAAVPLPATSALALLGLLMAATARRPSAWGGQARRARS